MYTVRFMHLGAGSASRPVIYTHSLCDNAVQVALNLHRVSNVPHEVSVHHESDDPKVFRDILLLTTEVDLDVPDTPAFGRY